MKSAIVTTQDDRRILITRLVEEMFARCLLRHGTAENAPRIYRAKALIQAGNVKPYPEYWAVTSATQPSTVYQVINNYCPCPDATRHPAEPCKHRYAATILGRALRLMRHAQWAEYGFACGIAWEEAGTWTFLRMDTEHPDDPGQTPLIPNLKPGDLCCIGPVV